MNPFLPNFQAVQQRLADAARRYGRAPGEVRLIAVSKLQPASAIRTVAALGQRDFGENYLQEVLEKMPQLADLALQWHFIGHIQSNKTAAIATHFDWVHTVDRLKIAQRLNDQRPPGLPPLNVCIQVNISGEASKSGAPPAALDALLPAVVAMPQLKLRGLMALPAPATDLVPQRAAFRQLATLRDRYRDRYGLDTLSMGTSGDYEAAIAEGATLVRIGTAIFGPRPARAP
jgi:hypothetical protein